MSLRWSIYIINSVDKTKLSRLEALVWALTFWHGLGWDFLRNSTKPFGWFSDSFTQVTKKKEKTTSIAEKFVRHFAICVRVKQAHTSGYSHQNTFCGACANKMPLCYAAFVYCVLLWYWTSMIWSTDTCQKRYPLTSITWPYRGLKLTGHRGQGFFWSWPLTRYWFFDRWLMSG